MFLFLLLALLLPALALAQPTHWSVAASTCVPDEASLSLYRVDQGYLTFRPGTAAPRAGPPLLVRCPIHGPSAEPPRWTIIEAVWVDPDGLKEGTRLEMQLKRQAPGGRAEWIGGRNSDGAPWGVIEVPWDFTRYTYWLELRLWRRTPSHAAPRVVQVWLREGIL